jgi:predicted carbohydrate-binding protein with CBM5 and CBM33 domain
MEEQQQNILGTEAEKGIAKTSAKDGQICCSRERAYMLS